MGARSTQDQMPIVVDDSSDAMEASGGSSSLGSSPQPAQPVAPQSTTCPVSDNHLHIATDLPQLDGNQSSQPKKSNTPSGTKKRQLLELAACYLESKTTTGQQTEVQHKVLFEEMDRCWEAIRLALLEFKPKHRVLALVTAVSTWIISEDERASEFLKAHKEKDARMAREGHLPEQEPCPPEECEECQECQEREECQECEKYKDCTECRECTECANCKECNDFNKYNEHKAWEAADGRVKKAISELKPENMHLELSMVTATQIAVEEDGALEFILESLKRDAQKAHEDRRNEGNHN
ncbi:hypothetical protein CSOJ01_05732 [Colletotrichum sojae]|uniref:Uncharacterized protein n=1 Tax=Colletotrichum sojae TaxID=2175907 RepID=A0A8H6JF78_9PEZI|nr:hypothetical protein CSOJ01_05732 [Colletotrichum sojae]